MRPLAVTLLTASALLVGWAGGHTPEAPSRHAAYEVAAPRVRVLFEDPALLAYAQRVAREAEAALDVLEPLFGSAPPVTLRVEGETDVYNGLASALPRPNVGLRALFPTDTALGYGAESDLALLLVHELTHVLQFAFLEGRGAPRLGLVGETAATPPPAWLIEGLAVWAESTFTAGGRRDAALTRGLLESVALAGRWPTLPEVSLATFSGWPGAQAQYLFGGAFTDALITRHGFGAVLASLRAFNAGGVLRPFAAAWREAVGTDLEAEWATWRAEVLARARTRAAALHEVRGVGARRTATGWYTRAPTPSPDGRRLAWVSWPAAIKLAEVGPGGTLEDERTLLEGRLPTALAWLDARTLVYARVAPRPGRTLSELFALDVHTGVERQLTNGARAKLPAVTPEGCVLFVRDAPPERARLDAWCEGDVRTRWTAPPGVHPVGVAVSPAGQVALSLWQRGAVRLALLDPEGGVRWLTPPELQALEPAWRGERALLFRAVGPQGVAELFELSLTDGRLVQQTRTLGGAFAPAASPEGTGVWYVALGGGGYDVAFLSAADALQERTPHALAPAAPPLKTPPAAPPERGPFPVRPYTPLPSLAPFGWLPSAGELRVAPFGAAAEVSVLGLDDSAAHSYAAVLGFDTALTATSGLYGYVRYDYGAYEVLRAVPRPLRFGVQAGAWPYAGGGGRRETAFGVRAHVGAYLPLDRYTASLRAEGAALRLLDPTLARGALEASAHAALAEERTDPWGYRVRGGRAALHGVWRAARGLSLWGEGVVARTEAGWGVEAAWLAGFRPRWPLPAAPATDVAVLSTLGLRRSLPLALRYGDGLYAAERVTLEPRLRLWLDGALHVGADLTASLDAVLGYGTPVSFGVTLGYAGGVWLGVGPRAAF